MVRTSLIAGVLAFLSAVPATADFAKVTDKSQFVNLINGRTLARPLVRLQVTPDGQISGRGAAWDVTGQWSWQDGYFCRDLEWGGSDLGYNCQEVRVHGRTLRFISDRGAGEFADLNLR